METVQSHGVSEQNTWENIWGKKEKLTWGRRKLQNEEICSVYFSPTVAMVIMYNAGGK
jgi:hypothetical protein